MRLKSIKAGVSPAPGYIPAGSRIFSLGRTIVIIDNGNSQKLRFPAVMTTAAQRIQGQRPTMTEFNGELSPPFEIVEPAPWRAPGIFNSPHSRSVYPPGFLHPSRIGLTLLPRSPDSLLDRMIRGVSARGCPC